MNIALVDDQFEDLRSAENFLKAYLREHFSEEAKSICIDTFTEAEKFFGKFESGEYDLLILDIFMKPLNGIQIAEIIRRQNRNVAIIFLTNSEDYILEGYKVFAVGYFLKPLAENAEQFSKTFSYIFPKLLENQKKLSVRVIGDGEISVPYKNILYADIDERHYLCLHLTNKKISVAMTYDEFFKELENDLRFVECYHRILVNMEFIKQMDEEDFILNDGTRIPISQRKSKAAKLKYMSHLMAINPANTWQL